MKKSILALLLIASTAVARPSVNVLEYGPPTAGTITNVLDRVGTSAEVALVIKGGRWNIGTNFTTPTNVFLEMEPGAFFYIQTTNVITINGRMDNNWALKFTGPGANNILGTYTNYVRIPMWWGTNGTVRYGQADLGAGAAINHSIAGTNMQTITMVLENDANGLTNRVLNGTNFFSKFPNRLFWAAKNGNQVIGTTNTHVTFSNTAYNLGGLYITNEGRFVNQYTGVYRFAAAMVVSGATDQAVHMSITTNWAPVVDRVTFANLDGSGRENQPSVETPYVFFDSTGVSVRVNVKLESGGGCPATNSTYFTGIFMGN